MVKFWCAAAIAAILAGPAWAEKPYDHVAKGGTGAGVRTLIALARGLAR